MVGGKWALNTESDAQLGGMFYTLNEKRLIKDADVKKSGRAIVDKGSQ